MPCNISQENSVLPPKVLYLGEISLKALGSLARTFETSINMRQHIYINRGIKILTYRGYK